MAGGKIMRVGPQRPKPRTNNQLKALIRSTVGAELKKRDLSIALVEVLQVVGSITNLTLGISQGDLFTEREGNRIQPTSMVGTFVINGDLANGARSSEYKVYVAQWLEDESVNAATNAKIWDDNGDPFQGTEVPNKGQYKILYQRSGLVSNDDNNSNNHHYHHFRIKRASMKQIYYSGATAKKNHIFLGCLSSDSATGPDFRFTTRLRYTDS